MYGVGELSSWYPSGKGLLLQTGHLRMKTFWNDQVIYRNGQGADGQALLVAHLFVSVDFRSTGDSHCSLTKPPNISPNIAFPAMAVWDARYPKVMLYLTHKTILKRDGSRIGHLLKNRFLSH